MVMAIITTITIQIIIMVGVAGEGDGGRGAKKDVLIVIIQIIDILLFIIGIIIIICCYSNNNGLSSISWRAHPPETSSLLQPSCQFLDGCLLLARCQPLGCEGILLDMLPPVG